MSFNLQPAEGKEFIDREELVGEMLTELKNRKSTVGYALYGRRRIGKTSILLEVKRKLEKEKDVVVVYFSLWDLLENRLSEFIRQFSAEIIESYNPHLGMSHKAKSLIRAPLSIIKETLAGMNVGIKIRNDIEILLTFDERKEDMNKLLEEAFSLPEKLAAETNTKCVVLLDEFPSIIDLKNGERLGEGVIRKIRTIRERQKGVSLCISGSIRKTMSLVALSPASAFYGQFVVREVEPLERKYVAELMRRNLGSRLSEEVIEEIFAFSGGIPFYVQFIGRMLCKRENIDINELRRVIAEFLFQEGNVLFKGEFENLGAKERLMLSALSKGNVSPSEIANHNQDKLANVGRFLAYLEEKGYVLKTAKGSYAFSDPVFEKWLKSKI